MTGAPAHDDAQLQLVVRQAIAALDAGDGERCRQHLDALAAARPQPVLESLAGLARELNRVLGGLDGIAPVLSQLPDAGARLEHVVSMTAQASHRTLDLTEACGRLAEAIEREAPRGAVRAMAIELRGKLSEIALAQGYQDLTGQVIHRVAGVVGALQGVLAGSGEDPGLCRDPQHGPPLAGIDRPAISQTDADRLLSELGL